MKSLKGSRKDPFWNEEKHEHECCGSKASYVHKVGCKACGKGLMNPRELDTPKLRRGAWRMEEEMAKTMYHLYTEGPDGKPMSLAQIGKVYRKTRQAVYDVFASRGWPLRSKQRKGLTKKFGISFTLDAQGFLRGTNKKGERVYLHKMAWEKTNGPLPDGWVIFHLDGAKTNNDPANLKAQPKKGRQIHLTCKTCGEGFEIPEWRESATYCSAKCRHADPELWRKVWDKRRASTETRPNDPALIS